MNKSLGFWGFGVLGFWGVEEREVDVRGKSSGLRAGPEAGFLVKLVKVIFDGWALVLGRRR